MFLDEIRISVRGGKGGQGCMSFRREKYVPRGGPDGGDGGDGGAVILLADPMESSLHPLRGQGVFEAGNGRPGGPNNCTGARGRDLVLRVPPGTVVKDALRGNVLGDLVEPGARLVAARGGKRGRGNKAFATSTNRAPRRFEKGLPGEERELLLVLKLIADVGLIGLPNAGKSTLLSVLSAARPKIASYPFTTLRPCLGIVELGEFRSCVMADIPGLIEGASEGKGLGHRFLRHVERTRILLHLVDCSEDAPDPFEAYTGIRKELEAYSPQLAGRPSLVAGTKIEGPGAEARFEAFAEALESPVLPLSSIRHRGLKELRRRISELLAGEAEGDSGEGRQRAGHPPADRG